MIRLLHLLGAMTRFERSMLALFSLFFVVSLGVLIHKFYYDSTVLVPKVGGTYIEGSVGELRPLNPWFTVGSDVNRDIVSLVFSGLLRYNPQTQKIEEDLATISVSKDGRTYTLALRDGLLWHDSTSEKPHYVTSDDVLFTFQTIQHPEFPNTLLRENYRGVEIKKVDARTVRFILEKPYNFFTSNLTLGLLPAASFEGIPVGKLHQALDFGFEPVGAGPYRVHSINQVELSTEVTLERFQLPFPPTYRLERVVFRLFPDYPTLMSDIQNLDGVRLVPRNERGEPRVPRRFTARTYTLPQYVAIFYNLDKKSLQDKNLRLGLQLGTNKQALVDAISQSAIVDTPLLEIDTSDWRYHFDLSAAQGSLFESDWNLPEKIRLQRLLEMDDANRTGVLRIDPVILLDTGAVLTFTGSYADVEPGSTVNGISITDHPTMTGAWITALPTHRGTGALRLGDNLIKLIEPSGRTIDSFYLFRTTNAVEYKRAEEEQRLLRLFRRSRAGSITATQKIDVSDFMLDRGKLRRRNPDDPSSIRRNDRGEELRLTLLTSSAPPEYKKLAERIAEQWRSLGVHVQVVIPESDDVFNDRLQKRDYDVLLFGQSLLDNLDSYSYWHSSGMQKVTGDRRDLRLDAYNLSQYSSFKADALLETIRRSQNDAERERALAELRNVLTNDVQAIFLYSPLYTFAHHQDILGIELGKLSLHSDRFLTLHRWYVKQERTFKPGQSWLSFFRWIPSNLTMH